jgi:RNA polymerase sigma-70 factor (ECF subfamily)
MLNENRSISEGRTGTEMEDKKETVINKEEDLKTKWTQERIGHALTGIEPVIKRILRRILRKNLDEVDDAWQETSLNAFKALTNGAFDERSTLKTWVTKIAFNAAFGRLRKNKNNPLISNEYGINSDPNILDNDGNPLHYEPKSRNLNPEEVLQNKQMGIQIETVLNEIPEMYRWVLLLRDQEGLKNEEVAHIFNLTVPAVKSRLIRAREMFKTNFEKLNNHKTSSNKSKLT